MLLHHVHMLVHIAALPGKPVFRHVQLDVAISINALAAAPARMIFASSALHGSRPFIRRLARTAKQCIEVLRSSTARTNTSIHYQSVADKEPTRRLSARQLPQSSESGNSRPDQPAFCLVCSISSARPRRLEACRFSGCGTRIPLSNRFRSFFVMMPFQGSFTSLPPGRNRALRGTRCR